MVVSRCRRNAGPELSFDTHNVVASHRVQRFFFKNGVGDEFFPKSL